MQRKQKSKNKDFAHEFIKDYFKNTVQNSLNNHNDIIRSSQLSTSSSADSFYGEAIISKVTSTQKNITLTEQIEHEWIKYENMKITDNCSDFWYKNESNLPILSQVACVVLTAIATSVPSERAFSAGTNQICARRNRLSTSRVEKIMFLLTN